MSSDEWSRASWLLTGILISACSGPELSIGFEVSEPYRSALDAVTLSVYEPLPAAPFDCDALALSDVQEGVLALSLVGESSIRGLASSPTNQVPISDLDRASRKLFVAEGRNAEGEVLVSGCAELGEVDGRTEVMIPAEPTKQVAVEEQPPLSLRFGEGLEQPIVYRVTDLMGQALPEVELRWRIDGAGGESSNGRSNTNSDGRASILPSPPGRPGPFVLDVNIRWAVQRADEVSGFIAPQPSSMMLNGRAIDYRQGNIGPDQEPGFVALVEETVGKFKVVHVYQSASGELLTRNSQSISMDSPRLGIIEYRARERDRAIVVGVDRWIEVGLEGGLTERDYFAPVFGARPQSIHMSGGCEPGAIPEVFINYVEDVVGFYGPEGRGTGQTGRLDMVDSGCVNSPTGDIRALLLPAFDGSNLGLVVTIRDEDDFLGGLWLAINRGVGFAPPIGGGSRFLLGSQLDVNDVVVSRFSLRREGTATLALDEQGTDLIRNCVFCIPLFNRGGDVDRDGQLDVVTLIERPRANLFEPVQHALYVFLGRQHRGIRINADVDIGPEGLQNPVMLVLDVDRDGHDDVILGERPNTAGRPSVLEIYPMAPFE